MTHTASLRQRILNANTVAEVDNLLTEGRGYQMASPVTKRRWKRAAKARRAELSAKKEQKKAAKNGK